MAKQSYHHGTGRRKTAIAQVKLLPGDGAIVVNGVPYEQLFSRYEHRRKVLQPLLVTENMGKFSVTAKVTGGGISGWADAMSLAIARALVSTSESLKPVLRQNGLLTRDPRIKERKKPGLRRARKAPQYTKR
ncbi:MAG: 30S ribosomal protein S9 [Chloroflexi bacterium]|nr:30S ribosomal protein S9 [Chloroflexota bacterium]